MSLVRGGRARSRATITLHDQLIVVTIPKFSFPALKFLISPHEKFTHGRDTLAGGAVEQGVNLVRFVFAIIQISKHELWQTFEDAEANAGIGRNLRLALRAVQWGPPARAEIRAQTVRT